LLEKYRPDLKGLPTTNGRWSTGDGVKLAEGVGAATVDMDRVQVHPTAFLDLNHPEAERKTLCAELLRGVGGLLLTRSSGERFVDELAPRDVVVAAMRAKEDESRESRESHPASAEDKPGFIILLTEAMASQAKKHTDHYLSKKLMTRFESLQAVADWAGLEASVLGEHIRQYNAIAEKNNKMTTTTTTTTMGKEEKKGEQRDNGGDDRGGGRGEGPYGKMYFHNTPIDTQGGFLAGVVVPAIHYTMGGLKIAPNASVVTKDGHVLEWLVAGGEVSGGMHGKNRLGGNALTECVVFGRVIGKRVVKAMTGANTFTPKAADRGASPSGGEAKASALRKISMEELQQHAKHDDCWVALHGKVYDLTDFVDEHPAGPEAILQNAGADGTAEFEAIHSQSILDDFDAIGELLTADRHNDA